MKKATWKKLFKRNKSKGRASVEAEVVVNDMQPTPTDIQPPAPESDTISKGKRSDMRPKKSASKSADSTVNTRVATELKNMMAAAQSGHSTTATDAEKQSDPTTNLNSGKDAKNSPSNLSGQVPTESNVLSTSQDASAPVPGGILKDKHKLGRQSSLPINITNARSNENSRSVTNASSPAPPAPSPPSTKIQKDKPKSEVPANEEFMTEEVDTLNLSENSENSRTEEPLENNERAATSTPIVVEPAEDLSPSKHKLRVSFTTDINPADESNAAPSKTVPVEPEKYRPVKVQSNVNIKEEPNQSQQLSGAQPALTIETDGNRSNVTPSLMNPDLSEPTPLSKIVPDIPRPKSTVELFPAIHDNGVIGILDAIDQRIDERLPSEPTLVSGHEVSEEPERKSEKEEKHEKLVILPDVPLNDNLNEADSGLGSEDGEHQAVEETNQLPSGISMIGQREGEPLPAPQIAELVTTDENSKRMVFGAVPEFTTQQLFFSPNFGAQGVRSMDSTLSQETDGASALGREGSQFPSYNIFGLMKDFLQEASASVEVEGQVTELTDSAILQHLAEVESDACSEETAPGQSPPSLEDEDGEDENYGTPAEKEKELKRKDAFNHSN